MSYESSVQAHKRSVFNVFACQARQRHVPGSATHGRGPEYDVKGMKKAEDAHLRIIMRYAAMHLTVRAIEAMIAVAAHAIVTPPPVVARVAVAAAGL
jgi:hypothetical protein